MTENMVGALCAAAILITLIVAVVWLANRNEERDAERLYFKETGKLPKRYLK